MDYKTASTLQPGDRVMSVGDEHFLMKWGGFMTTGTILFVTEDCRGILIERDKGGRMWVSAAHVRDYSLEGERKIWRVAVKENLDAYLKGPFARKADRPLQCDADPQRLLSKHSLLEVRDMLVRATAATGSEDEVKKIFRAVGLDSIDHIQPWHHDVIYNASLHVYRKTLQAEDDIEAMM
jgi:hypothetical protein